MKVLFGGAFNPVHHGHIRTVIEIAEYFDATSITLVPTGVPVFKNKHELASNDDRLNMLSKAFDGCERVSVDHIELENSQTSYTYHTLFNVRQSMLESESLVFVIGYDNLMTIELWHEWERLLDIAHILVVNRPMNPSVMPLRIREWIDAFQIELPQLAEKPAGGIAFISLPALEVSSSLIRQKIRSGQSIKGLVPESVSTYIYQQQLYT